MGNIEISGDAAIIYPIQSDEYDQECIDNCLKIAKLNALNKMLYNNCCNASCGICDNSISKSVANGYANADIMLVDAFPSQYETFTGCFTDEKGYFLESVLKSSRIKRSDIYCTTVIKCFNVQDTNVAIINNCIKHYFRKELDIIKPKKIIFTYSAFQACLKYGIIPHLGSINYFTKTNVQFDSFSADMYIIYDFKQLSDQQKEAFKQGLNYILQ